MEHNNDNNTEFPLSSQGPIYEEFMDTLNNEIDGQQPAKEKFIKEILNLNHNKKYSKDTLRTIILTGPEEDQKLKLVKTTAKILFGHENCMLYYNFKNNPDVNPLYAGKEGINYKNQRVFLPNFGKNVLQSLRYYAHKENTIHKIAQKHPGLTLVYFENIDSLSNETRKEFFQVMHNTKKIYYDNVIYDLDFSNSIVIFGFNKKESNGIGFANQSNKKDIKTILANELGGDILFNTDKVIEFQKLEPEHVDMYIQRLANNFKLHIHNDTNIKINYSPELIEAFKNEELKYIDQTTKNIERKRKLVEEKVSSFITKNKKIYTSNPQENQIILSVDPKDNDSIIGKTIPYNHSNINTNE